MKIFGQHDAKTIAQFEQVRTKAVDAALMADGHVGYVMPIGGVASYRDQVSVVGVGFDIACIAECTPVTTGDGYFRSIEEISPHENVLGYAEGVRRPVTPQLGALSRGFRETVLVTLANGTTLRCTPDHRLRTSSGWRAACELGTDDRLLGFALGDGHLTKTVISTGPSLRSG